MGRERSGGRSVGRAVRAVAVAVVLATSAAGCAGPPPEHLPEVRTEHAAVPSVPVAPMLSMRIDAALIEAAACAECDRAGGDRDRFFSGRLATASLGALLADPASPDRQGLGGNLFVSGYFGGIQLRSELGSIGVDPDGPVAPLLELVGRLTSPQLDGVVGELQRVAAEGTDDEVRGAAAGLLPVLAALYGYNLGYLRELVAHPPAGADPASVIECPTRWSCRTPVIELAGADRFDASIGRLVAPPDAPWAVVSGLASVLLDLTEPAGAGVWAQLLSGDGFAPDGYAAIVDLSGAFLQVSSVALAGAAEAAAGGDADLARRSLAVTSGLMAWAGSYFLGLASPLPDTSLPQLNCG